MQRSADVVSGCQIGTYARHISQADELSKIGLWDIRFSEVPVLTTRDDEPGRKGGSTGHIILAALIVSGRQRLQNPSLRSEPGSTPACKMGAGMRDRGRFSWSWVLIQGLV